MDTVTSRYHDVYDRWRRDPEGFWGEAAQDIDWIEPPRQVFDPNTGVYGRWFTDGVCNTCWNAVDRHVAAGRGEQAAIIYDCPSPKRSGHYLSPSPGRDPGARRRPAQLRRHQRGSRGALHADGARGGDLDARLRAHRRRAFGGLRRLCRQRARVPHRRRYAEADPVGELRARGWTNRRVQAPARRCNPPRPAQARSVHHPAAPAGRSGARSRPRPRLGDGARGGH